MRLLRWLRRQDPPPTYEQQRERALEEHLAQLPETERADLIAAANEHHEALANLGITNAFSCRRTATFPTAEEIRQDTASIIASAQRYNTTQTSL